MEMSDHEDRVFQKLFSSATFEQRLNVNVARFGQDAVAADLAFKLKIRKEVACRLVEDVLDTEIERFVREWEVDAGLLLG